MAKRLHKVTEKPWERQFWDTNRSYEAFRMYIEEGGRLIDAYRRAKGKDKARIGGTWQRWAAGQDSSGQTIEGALTWAERYEALQAFLSKEDTELWRARYREQREKTWELSNKILETVEQMLRFPIQEVQKVDGGLTMIIKPMRWRASDIPRLLEIGDKIGRLAAEEVTERLDITSDGQSLSRDVDFSSLTLEQLRRLADGEDIESVL